MLDRDGEGGLVGIGWLQEHICKCADFFILVLIEIGKGHACSTHVCWEGMLSKWSFESLPLWSIHLEGII